MRHIGRNIFRSRIRDARYSIQSFATSTKVDIPIINGLHEFNEYKKDGIVFVDFYADWCGPCKAIAPLFQSQADMHTSETVKFLKVNVDEAVEVAVQEKITALPLVKVFRNGEELNYVIGAKADVIIDLINSKVNPS